MGLKGQKNILRGRDKNNSRLSEEHVKSKKGREHSKYLGARRQDWLPSVFNANVNI